ncbi:hypothetical protein EDC96DRAFT_546964 [Choanephora cucurbitarum]|nr:hypothetical protein EDC96DRAFT_546964 [Choanephora cucurbitarum]
MINQDYVVTFASALQILYHDIQSLSAHKDQISVDNCYQQSDVLLFSETWTNSQDLIEVPSFVPIARANCPRNRRFALEHVALTSADKLIETLTPILSSGFSRCLIVGDFNISFLQASRRAERMRNFFSSFGLASRTMDKPSTIYNTKIDEVFSNFKLENTGYYVSLTPSPHYPIYIQCTQS